MPIVATPLVPSTTNSVGTAFGAIVGGVAYNWLVAAPFIVKLSAVPALAVLGATPMGLAGIGAILATSLGTYACTHIAEVREAAGFVVAMNSIKTEESYPNDPRPPLSINNLVPKE